MSFKAATLACIAVFCSASMCWAGWPRQPEFRGFSATLELRASEPPAVQEQSHYFVAKPRLPLFSVEMTLDTGTQTGGCELPHFSLPPFRAGIEYLGVRASAPGTFRVPVLSLAAE